MTAGDEVTLTTDSAYDGKSDATTIYVGYPQLAAKVAAGPNHYLNPSQHLRGLPSARCQGGGRPEPLP